MSDDLYNLQVESTLHHQQLLSIIGARETVIDAALRVILDCAPEWKEGFRPMFAIHAWKVSK